MHTKQSPHPPVSPSPCQRPWRFLLLPLSPLLLFAALAGCASVSVYDLADTQKPAVSVPKKIYVLPFETHASEFKVGRDGEKLVVFRNSLVQALQQETIDRISKSVLPAQKADDLWVLPQQEAWAVVGKIERVRQGSRALRTVVGYGVGRTLFDTRVIVYDLSGSAPRPFLSFKTTGGSNWDGGALMPLLGPMPWMAGVPAVTGVAAGISTDVRRTSREITAALSQALSKRHVPLKGRPMQPKRRIQF